MEKENRKKIKEIFLEVLKGVDKKTFSFNKKQDSFENWDSFAHLELVSKVEEEFKIIFEIEEMIELDSPAKFAKLLEKKIKERDYEK
jgi:acyl carrier protein